MRLAGQFLVLRIVREGDLEVLVGWVAGGLAVFLRKTARGSESLRTSLGVAVRLACGLKAFSYGFARV